MESQVEEGERLPDVRVEVVRVDGSTRQISRRERATESLRDRADDIQAAIAEASDIAQGAMDDIKQRNGLHVSQIEASFGLALSARHSILVANASIEATFQVKITIDRS